MRFLLVVLLSACCCAAGGITAVAVRGHTGTTRPDAVKLAGTLDAYTAAQPPVWHSCISGITGRHQPRLAHVVGPYRVYNDSWGTRTCIRSTGANLTVETTAHPDGRVVVAYPDVQYGSAYGYTTPGSRLPVPVASMGYVGIHGTLGGRPGGRWIGDVDAWFFAGRNTAGHGTAEMIIVERRDVTVYRGSHIVRIGGQRYWLGSRETCQPGTDDCWPLIRFVAISQHGRLDLPLSHFVYDAKRYGLLHRTAWLGSFALGFENWSGGKGETVSLRVTR